ncbi:MAG: 50S ribosomal protein L10 [Gemmatimonadota bacterium]
MNVKEKKQATVDELHGKLESASSFYLTDFTGLTVKKVTELRSRLRKAGVEYLVVKNTLAERALEGLDVPQSVSDFFKGPTAVAISTTDPVAPAKVLVDFAKENDNKPAMKAAVVDGRGYTAAEVERLARLPGREQLLAELAGAFEAPMSQLLYLLQAKLQETLGLFEALRAQKENA